MFSPSGVYAQGQVLAHMSTPLSSPFLIASSKVMGRILVLEEKDRWRVSLLLKQSDPLFNIHWGHSCLPGKGTSILMQITCLSSTCPLPSAFPARLGWSQQSKQQPLPPSAPAPVLPFTRCLVAPTCIHSFDVVREPNFPRRRTRTL